MSRALCMYALSTILQHSIHHHPLIYHFLLTLNVWLHLYWSEWLREKVKWSPVSEGSSDVCSGPVTVKFTGPSNIWRCLCWKSCMHAWEPPSSTNVKRAWLLWDFKSLDHHPHRAQLHMSRRLEPHQKWVLRSRKGREFNKKESYSHFPSFSSFFFFIFYFLQFSCLNFIPFPKIYKSPLLHWVSTLKSQTR